MENIEILVPAHARGRVMQEIGVLASTRFVTAPSHRSVQRLLVSWLPDLDSTKSFREMVTLWGAGLKVSRGVSRVLPIILLSPGTSKAMSTVLLQNLIHWSQHARPEPYVARTPEAARRMILAHRTGAEEELIASASIEDGKLVVWSCEPRRFEVPIAEIPALAAMSTDTLAHFELSKSGSRIRWPDADVDVNLDTIREHADPEVRRRHEAEARKEAARYAKAIRRFREERGLKQTEIGGLTDRQIRRLEDGETVPHIDTLKKLAAAHEMSTNDYLAELAKRSRGAPQSKREAAAKIAYAAGRLRKSSRRPSAVAPAVAKRSRTRTTA